MGHLGHHFSLVLGPPGTGKTTHLLTQIERETREVPPSEIAFVSFTRAAREEAKRRTARAFECVPDDLQWFRTIHSTAFKLLELGRGDILSRDDLAEFTRTYGYEFSALRTFSEDEDDSEITIRTTDDALLATFDWGRSRLLDHREAARRSPFGVDRRQLDDFVRRYTAFRQETKKYDFHDLLAHAMASPKRPPVRIAFIDEAQDLSPAQVKLVERWFASCERVYVAGDDDQAIYTFSGGDPDWILRLAQIHPVTILDQSYRVPALAYDVAQRVISRNRRRVVKVYEPKDDPGELLIVNRRTAAELIEEQDETFVLGRNWRVINGFAKLLRQRGVAFAVERFANWSPLGTGRSPVFRAWRSATTLRHQGKIGAREFENLISFIPSGKAGSRLPRGAKKKAQDNGDPVTLEKIRTWGLGFLAAALEREGPGVMVKIPRDLRTELLKIQGRYGYLPKPKVILTSMHSSKGREADTVIIIPDMTRATYRAFTRGTTEEVEAEHRVAYVAATRAKRRLIVCFPESTRFFPFDTYARRALSMAAQPIEDDWQHG